MPTGYTAILGEKDDVSFRDFALRCARDFGALVEMRDQPLDAPIPKKFKPSSYHKDGFAKACADYYAAMTMRNDEAEGLANESYLSRLEDCAKYTQKKQDLAVKYGMMLAKVAKWESPTPEHDNHRNFMISQLEGSLDFDCDHKSNLPKKMAGEEYRTITVENAKRNMDYHKKEFAEEVRRVKGRNKWIRDLVSSLPEE